MFDYGLHYLHLNLLKTLGRWLSVDLAESVLPLLLPNLVSLRLKQAVQLSELIGLFIDVEQAYVCAGSEFSVAAHEVLETHFEFYPLVYKFLTFLSEELSVKVVAKLLAHGVLVERLLAVAVLGLALFVLDEKDSLLDGLNVFRELIVFSLHFIHFVVKFVVLFVNSFVYYILVKLHVFPLT